MSQLGSCEFTNAWLAPRIAVSIIQKMNIATAFAESAGRHPQKTAIFWGSREYSYAEVAHYSQWIASHLVGKLGLKCGDRVGLWLKNCPEFVAAYFGILEAGGIVVPINNFLKSEEVNYILSDSTIDLLITDHELGTHHRALEHARPGLRLFRVEEITLPAGTDCDTLPPSHPCQAILETPRISRSSSTLRAQPVSPRGRCSPTPIC
jgi:acyl-CoA synthetase (AMP-forming)/AMP-acid ligase II